MNRGLVLEFTKMHGAGNDFIVIDNRFFFLSDAELARLAVMLCRRRFGVGADGILALEEPRSDNHDFHMTYVNADGSPGEMCGNGARCLVRFAFEAGLEHRPLRFTTLSGSYEGYVAHDDVRRVRVILPTPSDVRTDFTTLQVDGRSLNLSYVQAGVPHAVCFESAVDECNVADWGAFVRHHSDFAPMNGANVDFVELAGSESEPVLKVRCYERGVEAETLACGTGAVSSFAAAVAQGLIPGDDTVITMRGGDLRVGYTPDRKGIFLEGPTETVYRGTLVL